VTELTFDRGTLVLEGPGSAEDPKLPELAWDERTKVWRAPAHAYRDVVTALHERGATYTDRARAYEKLPLTLARAITPRPHQVGALRAWIDAGRRGVVQLPTGAGKTILAVLAVVQTGRPALVIVPTIDLLHQWHDVLSSHLGRPVGALGGGEREILDVTVATYDSAVLNVEQLGGRFGLLIVDECHHLPAPQYRQIALGTIAPFRLGLTATVERADGKEAEIFRLLGPLVYEGKIGDMVETVLSPYDVVSIEVPLTADEAARYAEARERYVAFLKRCGVDFARGGWMEFVQRAARIPGGREAMRAYREQKRLAQAASGKLAELWKILRAHPDDRVIVFTDDNEMAYKIGCEFFLPVLTHQTKLAERKRMLAAFRAGELSVIVTSKVLNEGVDVPEARVGVVVSGSGGVREHVQRLGRILRHRPGKRAVLYEVIAKGTSELHVNARRKRHHAYQGTPEIPG
jgi:superfamily II DNA or RNA helicase